jgi:lysophospholipase L1-like esterase
MKRQKDMRADPVRRVVALGESTTWGYSVSSKEKCWVNVLTQNLERFQGSKIELFNQGIGSNVLTTKCPSYEYSAKPAAIERVIKEVVDLKPDMVLLAYGLNDSRGGTSIRDFYKEYQRLIDMIREKTDPIIVILNTFYMHEVLYKDCPHWDESNYEITEVFNLAIRHLAERNGLILADIYSTEVGADWIVDLDHCHPNDLGHFLIANKVFEAIARNCSFVARTMPKKSLIKDFFDKYGNGPDKPSSNIDTVDVMLDE